MQRAPAVWLFKARSVAVDAMEPMFWGLEEEGIPFEIQEVGDGPAADLAKRAADGSPLHVGIGLGGKGEVVLHHHDLPAAEPLFSMTASPAESVALRHLGLNAARLVKGQPLLLDGSSGSVSEGCSKNWRGESEVLLNLIVEEVLKSLSGDKQ